MKTSFATFACADPTGLLDFWQREFDEHDMAHSVITDGIIEATADFGAVRFDVTGPAVRIDVQSNDIGMLYEIQSGIVEHLSEFDPKLEVSAWSGSHVAGARPPALIEARVTSVEPLADSWLRVTLSSDEDLERYEDENFHFGLLRSESGQAEPIWPVLNEKGTIDWPTGENALSHRIYTIRRVDRAKGLLVFDVFKHDGGETCAWAETQPIGEKVGLLGPSGGGAPDAPWILMAGDETAVPAILRSLERLSQDAEGEVLLLVGSRADILPVPETNLNLTWLFRSHATDLVETVVGLAIPDPSTCALWFAASQNEARQVRSYGQSLGISRKSLTAVAYWS